MSLYPAPDNGFDLGEFNPNYYTKDEDTLTIAMAERTYLKLTGGAISGGLTIDGALNASSLSIGGSAVDLSSISGITAGTALPLKALTLDSNRDLTGSFRLTMTSPTGYSYSSNASAYPITIRRTTTTTADISAISFTNTTTDPASTTPSGVIGFARNSIGNGCSDYIVSIRATNSTTDPVVERMRINASNGAILLSSSQFSRASWGSPLVSTGPIHVYANSSYNAFGNSTWNTVFSASGLGSAGYQCGIFMSNENSQPHPMRIGSTTSGGISLIVDSVQALTISNSRYVCIGNATANFPLEIALSGALTTASNYGVVTANGASYSQVGTSPSYYIACRMADGLRCNTVLLSSDRRLKTNFREITDDMIENFMTNCIPCIYDLKRNGQTQLGWVAQSIAKQGFHGLLSLDEPHDDLPKENDDDLENRLLTVAYERIPAILQLELLRHRKRLAELERQMQLLMSRPVNKKWAEKQA